MTIDDPKGIVRRGYDLVSSTYRRADFDVESSAYAKYLDWIRPSIGNGARVLDIGCGCGVPVARELVSWGCEVLGVDISEVQIARGREFVPKAEFVCSDIMRLDFRPGRFDAVVAFHSIIHLPLEDQETLLSRAGSWARPGGLFLGTVGAEEAEGYVEEDWLGVAGATMFWSHASPASYRAWLSSSAFEILCEDVLVDGDGSRHPVMLATKTGR